jgi:hypothetical protein
MVIALYDRSAMARGDKSVRLAPFGEQLEEKYARSCPGDAVVCVLTRVYDAAVTWSS